MTARTSSRRHPTARRRSTSRTATATGSIELARHRRPRARRERLRDRGRRRRGHRSRGRRRRPRRRPQVRRRRRLPGAARRRLPGHDDRPGRAAGIRRHAQGARRRHRRSASCPASRSGPSAASRSRPSDGVAFIDPERGSLISTIPLDGGAHGLASVTGLDNPKLYATTGTADDPQVRRHRGRRRRGQERPDRPGHRARSPATARARARGSPTTRPARWSTSSAWRPARPTAGPWTVYVVEPHGNAVFADARLPDGFVPDRLGRRLQSRLSVRGPPAAARLRRRRGAGRDRHRLARLRLAAARGHRRGADRRHCCSCWPGSCSGAASWPAWSACSSSSTGCSSSSRGSG